MASYTDTEMQTAVERMLGSGTRFRKNALGGRELELAFSDIQRSLSLVFMLRPRAVFYAMALAARKLLSLVRNEIEALEEITDLVDTLARQSDPIVDITPLGNAAAAIRDLTLSVGQRASAPRSLAKTPAYARFAKNIDAFARKSLAPNVVVGSRVTKSPEEARLLLPQKLRDLATAHADVVRRAGLLVAALDSYNALELPSKTASDTLNRIRAEVLDVYAAYMAGSTSARAEMARSSLLTLLTAKSLVLNVSSLHVPAASADLPDGTTGGSFASSAYPATPAALTTEMLGPWAFNSSAVDPDDTNRTLLIAVDDPSETVTVVLSPPTEAQLRGSVEGPFLFTENSSATLPLSAEPYNTTGLSDRRFELYLSRQGVGTKRIEVTLPNGAAVSAAQVEALLTAQLASTGMSSDFTCAVVVGCPRITANQPGPAYSCVVGARTEANALFGLTSGHKLTGTPDNRELSLVANSTEYSVALPAGLLSLSDVVTALTGLVPEVVPSGYPAGSPKYLQLTSTLAGYGSLLEMRSSPAQQVLGFVAGSTARSTSMTSADVARQLSRVSPRITATAVDTTVLSRVSARSVGPGTVMLFRVSGVAADLEVVGTTDVRATIADGSFDAVRVGDQLLVISGTNAGKSWIVSEVSASQLIATGPIAPVADNDIIEVVPTTGIIGMFLSIPTGPNAGGYRVVTANPDVPAHVQLDRQLVETPSTFVCNVSQQRVRIESRRADLTSRLSVDGGALPAFFDSYPVRAVGTSPWFRLRKDARYLSTSKYEVEVGDHVDMFASNYAAYTRRHTVVAVFTAADGGSVVQVSPEFPSDEDDSSWSFQSGVQVPFGRVTNQDLERYETLQARLAAWLRLSVNTSAFFRTLNAALSPLITNVSSSRASVNAAKARLFELHDVLAVAGSDDAVATLEYALDQHSSARVPAVDDILTLLRGRGCGRAADVLLAANFQSFFTLTSSTSSYTGALLEASQKVVQKDLPISRFGRTSASEAIRLAALQENDAEYDDIDPEQPDAPDVQTGNVP